MAVCSLTNVMNLFLYLYESSGTWFCSEECCLGLDNLDDDNVLQYSREVIWQGLNVAVRHDAVRQGNGLAMMSDWKYDMVSFWVNRHTTYFQIGHQFLASKYFLLNEGFFFSNANITYPQSIH